MTKMLCTATCYMPIDDFSKTVERYEDEYGDMRDLYDIPDKLIDTFLDSGNFQKVVWDKTLKDYVVT